MARFMNWLVNKLRFKRFALSSNVKLLEQFAFFSGSYSNWKHDPTPLIFVMYSGDKYTHGINIHYMNRPDKAWFGRALYLMKKGNQVMDGLSMYRFLKIHRYSIVKDCYRVYFTTLLNMKMVGAGLTYLDRLVYPITKDPWLQALNDLMSPKELTEGPEEISYDPDELRDRINQTYSSVPIQQQSIRRKAPYQGQSPFTRKAPWIK